MNVQKLASKISKLEALKKQVSIGNVREIIGLISDAIIEDSDTLIQLCTNGRRRAARRLAKKRIKK